jgi:cysteine rich repeat protein/PRC-barrel domain protein
MANAWRTVAASAACVLILWPSSNASAQSKIRDRLAAALETLEAGCAADIQNFCGKVTRGEGRLLSCMQAHDDQLSHKCQFTLYRASRKLEGALDRVGRIADACWRDIETRCGEVEGIGRCIAEKRTSLSRPCQAVAANVRQAVQGLLGLTGLPVYDPDNKNVGQVVEVTRAPDGKLQSINVKIGQLLGLGDKVVTINADKLDQLSDRIKLRLGGDELRLLPEARPQ